MKCRHKSVRHRCDWIADIGRPGSVKFIRRICRDCGAWLSLGPSDESDPRVVVELRAAAIVADHVNARGRLGDTGSWEELNGWCDEEWYGAKHSNAWHAGYLARCIAMQEGE